MPSAASWERNSSLDSWHVAEFEYPGVYVEEVPLGVTPIAGVGDVHDGLHRRGRKCGAVRRCVRSMRAIWRMQSSGMALAKLGSDAGKS